MSTATAVVLVVLIAAVVVAAIAIAMQRRSPRLRPLPAGAEDRYIESWRAVEARFVDAPAEAIREADDVVRRLMEERGHPMDERKLPEDYRQARAIAFERRDGDSGTEELRRAMLHYQAAFDSLLGDQKVRQSRREVA